MRSQHRFFLLACLALLVPAGGAGAWEWAYGPPGTRDDGFRRVAPVAACGIYPAGFVAVGTADSTGADPDVYVVRTGVLGNPYWERVYDVEGLGLPDDGIAIAEVAGGYVFLSNVSNGFSSPALTAIDCDGRIAWSQVYRDVATPGGGHLFGTDLIVAQTGNPLVGTSPGDFAVSGFWRDGSGDEDAFLMRTSAGGAPRWSQLYHFAQEAFYALTEAGPLAGAPTGDLVAVGRYIGGDRQGLAARVSGDDGTIGAPPQCMAQQGNAGTAEVYDSVTRLTDPFPYQFAMTGTSSHPAGWLDDVWITRGDPCNLMAESRVGDSAGMPTSERGFDIRQVLVADPGGPPAGSLAIAGSHAIAALGGATEAALIFVTPGPLMPVPAASRLFGDFGAADEAFHSLVQLPAGGPHPVGYALAGFTRQDWEGVGDKQDLYLVHYDPAPIRCEQPWNPSGTAISWLKSPLFPWWRPVVRAFPVLPKALPHATAVPICFP